MKLAAFAALALLLAGSAWAQAPGSCRVETPTQAGSPTEWRTAMVVRANEPCTAPGPANVQRTLATPPRNGNIEFPASGGLIYRPRSGFVGSDTFAYQIDNAASASLPRRTLTVSVTVQREAVAGAQPSDWPTCEVDRFTVGGRSSTGPTSDQTHFSNVATPTMRLRAGVPCGVSILGPRGSMTITAQPRNGSATIEGARVVYRPSASYTGSDAFSVRLFSPVGRTEDSVRFITFNVEVR